MKTSEMPKNSFYAWDKIEFYTNKNGKVFMAMPEQPIKSPVNYPVDVTVKASNKENFIRAVKEASIKDAMSHIYQEMLLTELT